MSLVKQLLLLHRQGLGKKTIARRLEISKNTVKSYLLKLELGGFDLDELLQHEGPVLEAKLFAGNPSYKEDRYEAFKKNLAYYERELKRTGVTKTLLWEEYRKNNPDGYGQSQFCHHLFQYLRTQKPSMVLHHQPAEKLFVDFAGKKLSYIDRETGEEISCQVFVACLPYSDYCFAMAVHSQSVADFLHALECCLKNLGGVPQTIVPDNLKAAIIKADNYEPDVNMAMNDFANHYETTVTPTRARHPKDKALVENQVKIIYSRVYARIRDQQFFSLSSLNEAISMHVLRHNQTRMQRKEYCREERFLANEKHELAPLAPTNFEIKQYRELKVAQNNHVYLSQDKHYYSVPYVHIGLQSKVIYTRSLVSIYIKGALVASHQRVKTGGYSTTKAHLCSHHQHYLSRSPQYYIDRAKDGTQLQRMMRLIFSQDTRPPEQLYKTCDGLFSLQRRTEAQILEKAISIAIDYEKLSYQFVKNIIENKTYQDYEQPGKAQTLPDHPNTRGRNYYQ